MADPTANRPEEDDDDAVAAEWAAIMDEEDGIAASGPVSNRVLNQDEIDSLLGFDGDGSGNGDNSGVMALINSAMVNYERLPMLEVVLDRPVRMMSTSLRNFTSDNVEVRSEEHTSELQSLMRISYAVFCLKKKKNKT